MFALVPTTDPAPAAVQSLAAGCVGAPQVLTAGGAAATGTTTFAAQPTAGHTITLNGVVFEFVASGATGRQVNIGAAITNTLDNLVSVINTIRDAGEGRLLGYTYTKTGGGNNVLTVAANVFGAAFNAFTLASSNANGTVSGATLTGGTVTDVIDLNTKDHIFDLSQSTNQTFQMPTGVEGQGQTLFLRTKSGAGNLVVTGLFNASNVSLTFDAVGDVAVLKQLGGRWRVLTSTSVTAA
jgi:hypothetical protein